MSFDSEVAYKRELQELRLQVAGAEEEKADLERRVNKYQPRAQKQQQRAEAALRDKEVRGM